MTTKKLMGAAKDQMKVGMATMGGQFAIGTMSNLPGMPAAAKGTANIANAGLGLVNVGQLVKTTKTVIDTIMPKKRK